ncbi:MAG: phospholipase D-like domain-containing protein, partial [Pseudomonadota bacterium]
MNRKNLYVLSLVALMIIASCDAGEQSPDGEDDTAFPNGKADSPWSECEMSQVVAYVNNPEIGYQDLRDAGVHKLAAKNIIAHRDGPDGTAGTQDDDLFDDIDEIDAVKYVGATAMDQLITIIEHLCGVEVSAQVIFSPQLYNVSHLSRVADLMGDAQKSLDIAMYSFSDSGVATAVEEAAGRGVSVRMVYESARDERNDPEGTLSARMEAAGVDVRYINKIMHHKFVIIDGPRDSVDDAFTAVLSTGSGNWSHSAGTKYDENTVFIRGSGEIVLRFQKEFNLLWENSRDFEYSSDFEWLRSMEINDGMINDDPYIGALFTSANFRTYESSYGPTFAVVSGLNTLSDGLVEIIEGAEQSIHLASGHMRSRPVAEALLAKAQSNPEIDIKIYLDGQEYISEWYNGEQESDLEECLAQAGDSVSKQQECMDKGFYFSYAVHKAGIPLRFKYSCYRWDYRYAVQMHHKYMI